MFLIQLILQYTPSLCGCGKGAIVAGLVKFTLYNSLKQRQVHHCQILLKAHAYLLDIAVAEVRVGAVFGYKVPCLAG